MTPTTKSPEMIEPRSRREANIASRRQRILESARTLLAEAGQAGLSMRKLAKAAAGETESTGLVHADGRRPRRRRALRRLRLPHGR